MSYPLPYPNPASLARLVANLSRPRSLHFSPLLGLLRVLTLSILLAQGCAVKGPSPPLPGSTKPYKVYGEWYQPLANPDGFREKGIASWYGKKFHGRKTSNGETYDMYGITAAHKTLPLGTHVRVVNLTNGKQLDVRINDRGPFVRGRIIDLSYAAAKELGIVGPGTAEVEISVLPQTAFGKSEAETESSAQGVEPDDAVFAFQVGAFKNRDNAEEQKRRLEEKYQHVSITHAASASGDIYRVRVGKFSSLDQARDQEKRLLQDGYSDMIIVAD